MSLPLRKLGKSKNFLSLAGNSLFAGFGFLSFVILTRSYNPHDFGQWVLYVTSATLLEMIRFGITRMALIRFLSGADEGERKKLIGSTWVISLGVAVFLSLLLLLSLQIFPEAIRSSGYVLLFQWYPVLAFVNLPFNNALSILQADQKFDRILYVRTCNIGFFILFLFINLLFFHLPIQGVVFAHLGINLLTSLYTLIAGWDEIKSIKYAERGSIVTLLNFGKYATGTLIGNNLLKSADTIIISLSPFLGTVGVALYSIPLKLTELIEVPLRSFAATAFPRMSKASIEDEKNHLKNLFYSYTGLLTLAFIPLTLTGLIFADFFVWVLGGSGYEATADIFRIFSLYALLLPIERFSGVALDSINKPQKNFQRVTAMVLFNMAGNIIVVLLPVFFFPEIAITTLLLLMAGVSVLTIAGGGMLGYRFLHKSLQLQFTDIFSVSREKIKLFKEKLQLTISS